MMTTTRTTMMTKKTMNTMMSERSGQTGGGVWKRGKEGEGGGHLK